MMEILTMPPNKFWRRYAEEYPREYNWLVSLVTTYRDNKNAAVLIDNRRQQFKTELMFATLLGLLYSQKIGSDEDHYAGCVYYLTELGRRVLLDTAAPSTPITWTPPSTYMA